MRADSDIRPDRGLIASRLPPVGAGFLLAAAVAVLIGLLVPLLVGSFDGTELAVVLAAQAICLLLAGAAALQMIRRLDASRRRFWALARRDELTGVGNYRALQERLVEEIARHSRHGREFALILLDLDRFKEVNEEYGHLIGDQVLAEVGSALRDEVRAEDAVFRQGGDEFAVIAPETNSEEAEEVAGRLRDRLRRCGMDLVALSATTGFAIFPGDGRSSDDLLACADKDLFATKRDGRAL